MSIHDIIDGQVERSTQGAVKATAWRKEPRDREFTYNGQTILVDTFVLPTIRWSKNKGQGWAEGTGLFYLARLLRVDLDREALIALGEAWEQFSAKAERGQP